ncbi:tetratricopeptide repeat protein [bacterium]|nr:tetratricopeptide repeat protein [bacterium]
MVRNVRALALFVCLLGLLASSGCSLRHPTLLTEADLATAHADSLSLDDHLALPEAVRAERRERAEVALAPVDASQTAQRNAEWLLSMPAIQTPYRAFRALPGLGDMLEHLDVAVGLDPTRADLWLLRGRLLDVAGDERRARRSLDVAWRVLDRLSGPVADERRLRRDVAVAAAWIERDTGWWDAGLAWLDRGAPFFADDDPEPVLVRGLLLAGSGRLEDAMLLSYGMPPMILPVVSKLGYDGFLGHKKAANDMLKRWLQAEVWMRRGRTDLAWHVIGEVPYWRSMVTFPHRLYQDLGLYAELAGRPHQANRYYALAYVRRAYRRSIMPQALSCDPAVLGHPHRRLCFFRLDSGAYHGGSLLAYATSMTMHATGVSDPGPQDQEYLLALEAIETCLRRGIRPDVALALRGRLRFSRGYYVLAELDLTDARQRFAEDGQVDPWTSYLLGLTTTGRDRPDEAIGLLEEAVGADPSLAGAWNALGVARVQLGDREGGLDAFSRAVALAPDEAEGWFNRGLLRCQEGQLEEGVGDLAAAARCEPENPQIARIIQLARLAERRGQPFLPGFDALGQWSPAAVDVQAHEGGEFSPSTAPTSEQWQRHLMRLIGEAVAETGSQVRADGLDAAALARLDAEYRAEPTPARRKLLAHAFVWLELEEEARRLLAPRWGGDLDADEVLLLLWLDQRAGEADRLRELAGELRETTADERADFDWRGLVSMLGEHRNPLAYGFTSPSFSIKNRSMGPGGGYGPWMQRQLEIIATRTAGMLQHPRGRRYELGPRGGAHTTTTAVVRKSRLR